MDDEEKKVRLAAYEANKKPRPDDSKEPDIRDDSKYNDKYAFCLLINLKKNKKIKIKMNN